MLVQLYGKKVKLLMVDLVEDGDVPCSLSSSKDGFLLPCDILGGGWASDGEGTWQPGMEP